MKRRTKIYAVLSFTGLAIIVTIAVYVGGHEERAKFMLAALSSLTVLTAIVGALYGDRFKMWGDPIDLSLETIAANNSRVDQHPQFGDVYLHHIRVRNATPHRAVINCRVWLEHVEDEIAAGKFEAMEKFAVPRLMQWAPAEFGPEVRSFSDEQVFDLGFTNCADGTFYPSWNPRQQGFVKPELLSCKPDTKRRYYLRIAADNFLPSGHQIVEVSASSATKKGDIKTVVSIRRMT